MPKLIYVVFPYVVWEMGSIWTQIGSYFDHDCV